MKKVVRTPLIDAYMKKNPEVTPDDIEQISNRLEKQRIRFHDFRGYTLQFFKFVYTSLALLFLLAFTAIAVVLLTTHNG